LRAGYPPPAQPVSQPSQPGVEAPVAGGVEEQQFDQGRSWRVRGTDEEGKLWRMEISGPHPQKGEGAMIGDRALHTSAIRATVRQTCKARRPTNAF
jgi:hypothetical protein